MGEAEGGGWTKGKSARRNGGREGDRMGRGVSLHRVRETRLCRGTGWQNRKGEGMRRGRDMFVCVWGGGRRIVGAGKGDS